MEKITYREYRDMLENPDTDDELIEAYSVVIKGDGDF